MKINLKTRDGTKTIYIAQFSRGGKSLVGLDEICGLNKDSSVRLQDSLNPEVQLQTFSAND